MQVNSSLRAPAKQSLMVHDRNNRAHRWGSTTLTFVIVAVLFVMFVFAVRWFRSEPVLEESVVSSIADVLKPDPISQAVIDGAIDTQSREATLAWVTTGERVGAAVRGEKDDRYYVEIKHRSQRSIGRCITIRCFFSVDSRMTFSRWVRW